MARPARAARAGPPDLTHILQFTRLEQGHGAAGLPEHQGGNNGAQAVGGFNVDGHRHVYLAAPFDDHFCLPVLAEVDLIEFVA